MILLFSLLCPNGHPVGGEPHEYPGAERPPDAWMNNVSLAFFRRVRTSKDPFWRECRQCHAPFRKPSDWYVHVGEMKAKTLSEAHATLSQFGPCEMMSADGRPAN